MNVFEVLKPQLVGELEVKEGELLDITDPGYDKDTWCRINDIKVKAGTYLCYAYIDKENKFEWGKRPWGCEIILKNMSATLKSMNPKNWKHLGDIGVDAGLAGFFINKPDFKDDWLDFLRECKAFDIDYDKDEGYYFCNRKDTKDTKGFFTRSGAGDGGYEVFALYDNDNIIGLRIDFYGEEIEEE